MEITNNSLFQIVLLLMSILIMARLVKKHYFNENVKRRRALMLQNLENSSHAGPKSDIEKKLTSFYQKRFFTTEVNHTEELRNLVIQFKKLDARDIKMRRAFIRALLNSPSEVLTEMIINNLIKDDDKEIKKFLINIIVVNKFEDKKFRSYFITEFNKKEKLLPPGPKKKAARATIDYIISIQPI